MTGGSSSITRIHKAEMDAARHRIEIDRLSAALAEAEFHALGQPSLGLHVATAAEVHMLERHIAGCDADAAELRSHLAHKQTKLKYVQEMLDLREAELYETEEAVRELEAKETARARELAQTREQLARSESRLLARQAEAARAARMADGAASTVWRDPAGFLLRRGQSDEADPDAQARMLRSSKSGKTDPAEAGYTQFHTLVMGVKLAAGPANTSVHSLLIDELWEEICRQRVPRSAWRGFVHEKALQATSAASAAKASAVVTVAGGLVATMATPAKGLLRSVSQGVERLVEGVGAAPVTRAPPPPVGSESEVPP